MKNILIFSFLCFIGSVAFGQTGTLNTDELPQLKASSQSDVSPIIKAIILKQQITPELKASSTGSGISENDKQIILKELNMTPIVSATPKIAAYSKDGVE